MSGRVLLLCAGEQERWNLSTPKQLVRVVNDEILIARTVRQCRARFSGEDPLLVSHLSCLRAYSSNAIIPRKRRYITETLFTSFPFWGADWTIVLLGDVLFTDELISLIISERSEHDYRFYGTEQEIYALSFTDYATISAILDSTIYHANRGRCKGKLWDLYYELNHIPVEQSGDGRIQLEESYDIKHFYTVKDDSRDFDTVEQYRDWYKNYLRSQV